MNGRLAQLVQSTSFTPRGSGVRIPQRPLLEFKQKQNLAYLIDLQGFDVLDLYLNWFDLICFVVQFG